MFKENFMFFNWNGFFIEMIAEIQDLYLLKNLMRNVEYWKI